MGKEPRCVLVGLIVAASACIGMDVAGRLARSAGPVGPRFRSPGEVEPLIAVSATSTPRDAASVYRIVVSGSCHLTGNLVVAAANTRGIASDSNCTISNCSAFSNSGLGIDTDSGATVADCTVTSSTFDGIVCQANCVIRGNICSNHVYGSIGAGILVTAQGNRIEGNACSDTDTGIRVRGTGTIIIRNTCSNNSTNWFISVNNYYDPIVDRRGVATTGVTGSATPSTLSTADPHANFTY